MKIYLKEPETNAELCIEMAPIDFERLLELVHTMFQEMIDHLEHKERNHYG